MFARVIRRAGALAALLAALSAPATADPNPFATTGGLTLNPVVGGVHESFDDTVHLPPIPVPLVELQQELGPFEISAYALPPTVAIPYTDAIQGSTALRLTIFDASLRLWDPKRRFAIEAGETVYNQTTSYATADFYPYTDERQYSRVVGGHYGIVVRLPVWKGFVETEVRYAPVLLGTQTSVYGDPAAPTLYNPEKGEQIDADVRYVHPAGKHTLVIVGLRYFNYTAAYNVPGLPLSDRNAALLPSFGYAWTTGRLP